MCGRDTECERTTYLEGRARETTVADARRAAGRARLDLRVSVAYRDPKVLTTYGLRREVRCMRGHGWGDARGNP